MIHEQIKHLVPAAVADAVLSDEYVNNCVYANMQAIDAAQLDEYTRGAVVFADGTEDCVLLTLDACNPDGIITARIAPIEGKT